MVQFTSEQENWLADFQKKMYEGNVEFGKNQLLYVPLTFHLTGTKNGLGYFSLQHVFTSLCEANQRFASANMYFYLADEIKYINDDELYTGKADAIWTKAYDYKNPSSVNVFYHGLNTEGWCGVYFGGVDVIFVLHRCQLPGGTTLTHELGHFFSLPHTFRGWEGGNIPSNIERLDGTNCNSAGDGFCDTKPDYVATRWGCPLYYELTDPAGKKFKPDSSLYMNYANDNCHSRFSNQQMAAMRANLINRNIARISNPDIITTTLSPPNLLLPMQNDSTINPNQVRMVWNAVPNAFGYHLQVARFGNWEFANIDRLVVNDTSITLKLDEMWPYSWRVKAISKTNVCNEFSEPKTFFTTKIPSTGLNKIENLQKAIIIKNPVLAAEPINFKSNIVGSITIFSADGNKIKYLNIEPEKNYNLQLPQGIYFIQVYQNTINTNTNMKLVVY